MIEGDASIRHGRRQRRTIRNEQEAVIESPECQRLKEKEAWAWGQSIRTTRRSEHRAPLPQGRGLKEPVRAKTPASSLQMCVFMPGVLASVQRPLAVCLKVGETQTGADSVEVSRESVREAPGAETPLKRWRESRQRAQAGARC